MLARDSQINGSVLYAIITVIYSILGETGKMVFEPIDLIIRVALVVATAFLFSIVFAAYMRIKSRKLLFISMGFGIFFTHGLITIPELFMNFMITEDMHLLIHLIALAFILFGTIKD